MTTAHTKFSLARRLKLQQIALFDKIVDVGSLLAASRELHMTQPALSKSIQELESHFGRPLLVRTRRGVVPTEFGRMLHGHCQALLSELRLLADDLNAWNTGVSGQVIVGSLISASAQLLPQAVTRLRETAPDVVVEVRVGINETMFEALARGELDVVVGLLPASAGNPLLEHVPLYDENLSAVVGRQHPLAGRPRVDPSQLARADWILPTPESEAMQPTQQFFDALGIDRPARVVESVSILTNVGMLAQSQMVALMPSSVARQFARLGLLSVLPLEPPVLFGRIGYTLCRGRTPTPATERMIRALHDVVA